MTAAVVEGTGDLATALRTLLAGWTVRMVALCLAFARLATS